MVKLERDLAPVGPASVVLHVLGSDITASFDETGNHSHALSEVNWRREAYEEPQGGEQGLPSGPSKATALHLSPRHNLQRSNIAPNDKWCHHVCCYY